jgi:hypothetical protein
VDGLHRFVPPLAWVLGEILQMMSAAPADQYCRLMRPVTVTRQKTKKQIKGIVAWYQWKLRGSLLIRMRRGQQASIHVDACGEGVLPENFG